MSSSIIDARFPPAGVGAAGPSGMPARPVAAGAAAAGGQWRECPDCGLFLVLPDMPPHSVAHCPRCNAVLRRHRTDPVGRPLVMAVTGLMLLLIASQSGFLDLSISGLERQTTVLTGPRALEQQGMWELGVVVLITTVLAPLLRLLALLWVLAGVRLTRPETASPHGLLAPAHLAHVFRWAEALRPWSMVEVFLLGVFVAYTKLIALAQVDIGSALYAMAALMLAMAGLDASMDPEAVWQELEQRQAGAAANHPEHVHPKHGHPEHGHLEQLEPGPPAVPATLQASMIGCDCCFLVSAAGTVRCPRCGTPLRVRKPGSIGRTWALVIAAACLYIPANILPVLTLIRLGRGAPSTIVGGAEELLRGGMWPLALLVFVASIMVPVLKLVGLTIMLVATQRGSVAKLRERTLLYRIVDFIGRWSMIDVFMISILTALVRLGTVASVYPGPGALAFCAVVILTILAALSFDPRLMWDAAEGNHP